MKQNKILAVLWDYFLMTVGSIIFCMAWTSLSFLTDWQVEDSQDYVPSSSMLQEVLFRSAGHTR
jgi:hypothetical protein